MADPKGYKLFVNLSASQVRRRLKGFGHGVRKVQSAGRNQAVIIHSATGKNLVELEAKFADVGYSSNEGGISEPIENLRNLGALSAAWLREAGVRTIDDLKRIGPVAAYRLVESRSADVTLNLLWALAAGLENRDWRELTEQEKSALRVELEST